MSPLHSGSPVGLGCQESSGCFLSGCPQRSGADLESLQLLAGSPVEGQCILPVPTQLSSYVQTLVLQFVVECAHTEVLQRQSLGWLPCKGRSWSETCG